MKRLKVGERVNDESLGGGVVVELIPQLFRNSVMVLWDKTPAFEYNCATNPSLWWPGCHSSGAHEAECELEAGR